MRRVKRILTEDEWQDGVTRHIREHLLSSGDPYWKEMEFFMCPFCVVSEKNCGKCPVEQECTKYRINHDNLFALQVYWEYRERFMEAQQNDEE